MFYWHWLNRRRNPLARVLFGVLGLVLLAGVLALGLFALVAFAVVGAIVALTRGLQRAGQNQARGSASPAPHGVIEGEFVVLSNHTASIKH